YDFTTGDATLYAIWTLNSGAPTEYTVTFNANTGTGSMNDQVSASSAALSSNGFSKEGYSFAGWSLTSNGEIEFLNGATYSFTSSTTLYAIWTLNYVAPTEYTVTFDANTGSGSMNSQVSATSANLTSNGFSKSGYSFGGWSLSAGGVLAYSNNATYAFTSSTTLYAIWTLNYVAPIVVYAVTYLDGGAQGTPPVAAVLQAGALLVLPTPSSLSKVGYRFIGWNDGHLVFNSGAKYAISYANVTFTATWVLITYSCVISYSANGGTGSMGSQNCDGLSVTLRANSFARTGYSFSGWNSQASGAGVSYTNSQVIALTNDLALTLYAIWSANSYQVTYVGTGSDGGSGPANQIFVTGSAPIQISENTFQSTGNTFTAWNTLADGSGISSAPGASLTLESNLNLYATWQKVAPTPTPTPTPTPDTSTPTEVKGEVTTTGAEKKIIPNQIVPITQVLQLQIPEGTQTVQIFVNGVLVDATISATGQIKLPVIVGPNDKVTMVVTDADGVVTTTLVHLVQDPISLANVNFDTGSSKLLAASLKILDSVIASIIKHGFKKVVLIGYTDSAGFGVFDNQKLSAARSAEVAKYLSKALSKYGVKITTSGKAEKSPIASNLSPAGMFLNRRVEVTVS
ncbi:MAG: InlB B-repeat-containing protein, partial [Actinomycetes bacterium]